MLKYIAVFSLFSPCFTENPLESVQTKHMNGVTAIIVHIIPILLSFLALSLYFFSLKCLECKKNHPFNKTESASATEECIDLIKL